LFFFSSRRRHTRFSRDWSSDVCSSDLVRKFEGADLVDEPAANPGGLFGAGRGNALPAEADALLLYALGLSEEAPEGKLLGVHPERARGYVRGFLDRHNISLQRGLSVEEGVVTRTEFEQLRGEL